MHDVKRLRKKAVAYAIVNGSAQYNQIKGLVLFIKADNGTLIISDISGLPAYAPGDENIQPIGPFGFHIHDGGDCSPYSGDTPFSCAEGHYNPGNQPHGNHAGDLPVLFSNNGYSYMSFFTNKFKPDQVIGKTVIIHINPDDYRTQPAGNSGKRIACGVIKKT